MLVLNKKDAQLLVNKLQTNAADHDFDWRLYAKLCITAGRKDKFREVAQKINDMYHTFPFTNTDAAISALPMASLY